MNRMRRAIRNGSPGADRVLPHKPVYRDQALADRINGKEQTFQSDSAEQGWTFRRNEARSRDFIAIQSQSCFGDWPDISLATGDHDPLRADGFQFKLFRQRPWQHGERSTSVHKKLNFFNMSRRTSQMGLYVEESHIKTLLKNTAILAQPINNATTLISAEKAAELADQSVEQTTEFELLINLKTAKQIGLTIPLARADKVIR